MQALGVGEVSEEEVSRLNQDLLMLSLDTDYARIYRDK